jgi:HEAT repeat protein
MRSLAVGLITLGLMGIASVGVTSPAHPVNKVLVGVLDLQTNPPSVSCVEEKKAVLMKELKQNTRVKLVDIRESVARAAKENPEETENFLIQNGSKLISEGDHKRVLDLIKDLPEKARNNIQIRTLEYFANLKGWVTNKDQVCKTNWWALRTELIKLGDNEATPMLVIFLKDKDPYLRLYAAELLSHIGDKRALKDLRKAGEDDENRKVRKNARWAYEQISGEKF